MYRFIIAWMWLAFALPASALNCGEIGESRPMSLVREYATGPVEEEIYSGSYALIVGGIHYKYFLPPLTSVQDETDDLAAALAAQGFRVRRVCDPQAEGPGGLNEIQKFLKDYDRAGRRLFIFLSGHGWVDEQRKGYYAAVDSPLPSMSMADAKKMGFSSSRLIDLTKRVKARHLVVAVDSCYSARLFTLKSAAAPTSHVSGVDFDRIIQPSRWFITAGSEREKTPSPSIFAPALTLGISGFADTPPYDGLVSATELALYVQHIVANNKDVKTTPRWGYIPLQEYTIPDGDGEAMFRYDPKFKRTAKHSMHSEGLGSFNEASTISQPVMSQMQRAWPDSTYQVSYYEAAADAGIVIKALDAAMIPYLTTPKVLPQNTRSNGLACHPNTPVEVVRTAARGLIENGVPLKVIDRITKNVEKNRYRLEILHFRRIASDRFRNITVDDLAKLTGCPDDFQFESAPAKGT